MPRRNLLLLLLTTLVAYTCYVRGGQSPYLRYVADGMAAIDANSLAAVPDRELFAGAMKGMVGVLARHGDQHSEFLPEEEAEPLRSEIRQQFGGIGVRIGLEGEPPRLQIVAPPEPGSPAARANLLPGDRILAIDDQATDDMTMVDVLHLMRGPPGTELRLTIEPAHGEAERTVELVREIIRIESVMGERRDSSGRWRFQLAANPRIAHIRITSFGDRTASELAAVLQQVRSRGVKAVVLDLRDNAGGSLEAAVAVCRMLLPEGKVIVETRGRDPESREVYATVDDGRYLRMPVAVLINQHSASAAEIVAACLQDHDRAVVLGQRSYGKGTVQQLVPMESGRSFLKLTWASFWRPSGVQIHRAADAKDEDTWGVEPDPGLERELTPEEYAAFQKYRAERDKFPMVPDAAADAPGNGAPHAEYVDLQLEDAVNHLQSVLGGEPDNL